MVRSRDPAAGRSLRSQKHMLEQQPQTTSPTQTISHKQQFQTQVSRLSTGATGQHRRNATVSSKNNTCELQHVSSLRVQYAPRDVGILRVSTSPHSVRQVTDEPDFIIEEREAWSRISPEYSLRSRSRNSSLRNDEYTHYDDSLLASSGDEDDSLSRERLPTFAPLTVESDIDNRPKTRHGLAHQSVHLEVQPVSPARSKFMEGSMNSRSDGVASSWSQYSSDYDTSASEAEDTTPRATRTSRSGSSIDLRDFQPTPISGSAIKRTLFGRRKTPREDDGLDKEDQKSKKAGKEGKKRLRKSLSGWNLHALGEKIGLFNDSSATVHAVKDVPEPDQSPSGKALLDDRKRKAEAAYAQQFGTKRHKGDQGTTLARTSESEQPITVRHRTSAIDVNATIRARAIKMPTRRSSLGRSTSGRSSLIDHDIRKQRSRRELEKENQQLRDMLQEHQAMVQSGTVRRRNPTPTSSTLSTTKIPLPSEPQDEPSIPSISLISAQDATPSFPPMSLQRRPLGDVMNTRSLNARSPCTTTTTPSPNSQTDYLKAAPLSINSIKSPNRNTPSMSTRKSLPAIPRSISMILEVPEAIESDPTPTPVLDSVHTAPATDSLVKKEPKPKFTVKKPPRKHRSGNTAVQTMDEGSRDKENCHVGQLSKGEKMVGDEVVLKTLNGERAEGKEEWKGWDEDVF